jgi:hypothetical protein
MAILSDLLVGKSETATQSGTEDQFQRRGVTPEQRQMYDVLNRAFLGQMVKPPETAVSVPTQQAVSTMQGMAPAMQQAGGPLASRLSAPAPTPTGGAGATWTPGANQQGLQTREQLGLPARSSYFTFMPSAEQVAQIGMAPVRPGGNKKVQQDYAKQKELQNKVAQRDTLGKPHAKADRQLTNIQNRLNAAKGPSYLPGTAY